MSRQRRSLAIRAGSLIAALVTLLPASAAAAPTPPPPAQEPLALIKSIVVGGAERTDADAAQVKVVRAEAGKAEPGAAGMRLYKGDQVTTGADAQVTILFLNGAAESGNQVIVGSDSRVEISSIFSWWGRFFANIKGAFDVKSRVVNLGVRGTEFEFRVTEDGGEAVLTVLEGKVQVERTETGSLGPLTRPAPELRADASLMLLPPQPFTSFAHAAAQDDNELLLEGVAGSTSTARLRAALKNICRQPHRFKISMPTEMPWLSILAGDVVEVKGGERKDFELEVKIDATNLRAASYPGVAAADCVDCHQEPGCVVGYSLPMTVKLKAGRVAGPGTDAGREPDVQGLEELTIRAGKPSAREKATEDEVRSVLGWTNRVILTSQPSYPAENVLPHFDSPGERGREFVLARFRAIWLREPGGFETLGDIYSDWGEGAKAVQAYEKELTVNRARQDSPDFLADLGEAYRQTGRFDDAEGALRKALAVNQQSAPALNALGNLYQDRAAVARDKRDNRQARALLETAVTYYQQLSGSAAGRGRGVAAQKTVSQVNRGEAVTALGELAQDEGRLNEARDAYLEAEQTFRAAETGGTAYAFTPVNLGRVYRQLGDVSRALNSTADAARAYEQSEAQFNRALGEHGDMAEAHVGLGSIYERTDRKDAAVQSYTRATRLRPEKPEPYYNLSVLLRDSNPRLAADYARTFLRLERPPLTQGRKGEQARAIAEKGGDRDGGTNGDPRTDGDTRTDGNTGGGGPAVKVPSFKGDKQEKAVKEITGLGLKAVVREQPDCETPGKVLNQEPRKGETVPRGGAVTIFVASPGENAPSVPPLEGRQRDVAERELRRLGFDVKINRRETDTPEGTILDQEPRASTRLKQGCTVELTVAVPVPPVLVENFVGGTLEQARRRLPGRTLGTVFGASLTLGRVTYDGFSRAAPGTVIAQNPEAGTSVPRGTAVNLVVAGGGRGGGGGQQPETVSVPRVIGMSLADAEGTLRSAGFVPKIVQSERGGTVYRQSPTAGSPAARGSTVNLWIALQLR